MDITACTLFGRARYRVLSALFAIAGKQKAATSLHLREIARRAQISPTATQYELRKLSDADLIVTVGEGRTRTYAPNLDSSIYSELRAILRKTDADAPVKVIHDSGLWKQKRAQQRRDYQSGNLMDKSAFLGKQSLARNARMTFPDDVDYDY